MLLGWPVDTARRRAPAGVATSVHEEVRDDLLNDGTDLARMPQGVDDLLVGVERGAAA